MGASSRVEDNGELNISGEAERSGAKDVKVGEEIRLESDKGESDRSEANELTISKLEEKLSEFKGKPEMSEGLEAIEANDVKVGEGLKLGEDKLRTSGRLERTEANELALSRLEDEISKLKEELGISGGLDAIEADKAKADSVGAEDVIVENPVEDGLKIFKRLNAELKTTGSDKLGLSELEDELEVSKRVEMSEASDAKAEDVAVEVSIEGKLKISKGLEEEINASGATKVEAEDVIVGRASTFDNNAFKTSEELDETLNASEANGVETEVVIAGNPWMSEDVTDGRASISDDIWLRRTEADDIGRA